MSAPASNSNIVSAGKGNHVSWRLYAAAFLLLAAAVLALRQKPHPNPWRKTSLFSWETWFYPLEFNALARLPLITGTITSLAGNDSLLVEGGQGGLLLLSRDGGENWDTAGTWPDSLRTIQFAMPEAAQKSAAAE